MKIPFQTPRTHQISRSMNFRSPRLSPAKEIIYQQLRQKIYEYVVKKNNDEEIGIKRINYSTRNSSCIRKNQENPFQTSYKQYIDQSFDNQTNNQGLVITSKLPSQLKPIRAIQSPLKPQEQQQKKPSLLLTYGIQMSMRNQKEKPQNLLKNISGSPYKYRKQRRAETSQSYNQQIFYPSKEINIQRSSNINNDRSSTQMKQSFREKIHKNPSNENQKVVEFASPILKCDEEIFNNISKGRISGYEQNSSISCEIEDYVNDRNLEFFN